MNKPKLKVVPDAVKLPRLGAGVIVRAPYFPKPTAAIVIGLFEDETNEIAVQAFPLNREALQIPAIPFFASEPDASVRSAAWPA